MPVFSLKMKYIGSESEKTLFKEVVKLTDKKLNPLSLIRPKAKYIQRTTQYLFVPSRFVLRVLSRDDELIFGRIINANGT
jgi:hypothetical protein